ncbi:MAG: phenylalanine--tRNA ligase subunit beta [Spirochaetia bacterium]|jgi:phenylalanyl-tRNA synthetase beta chain|nr:phenylalanine--tRNA ligase subunit beta [Spirochaetia bacterium]
MPKIEVNESLFFQLLGRSMDSVSLEKILPNAKAELDAWDDASVDAEDRTIKIELNDTNRPDLWSTAGLARQLRVKETGKVPSYPFFVPLGESRKTPYTVIVDESVRKVRPYLAGFVARGPAISDAMLKDFIQTQEKLTWNYGRKRRSVSIGLYRPSIIAWPVHFRGADPDKEAFVPLQETRTMTLRQILAEHPKGKEYSFILQDEAVHPLLLDDKDRVLSYPPIINSADLGAVLVGDQDLFIEVTGTEYPSVSLTASILACDLADMGFSIENVEVQYPYDTPFGRSVCFPCYFQPEIKAGIKETRKLLGLDMDAETAREAAQRMGSQARIEGDHIVIRPAEYRNDFLHPVDLIEDILMGMGMDKFPPETPHDFTIGRLSPIEELSRKAKLSFVGMGYQEMIYNYLGGRKDYIDKMGIEPSSVVKISNPMSESFEYLRNSPLPGLLGTESVSSKAPYPHRIFEIGKVALFDQVENYGIATRQYAGFLSCHAQADYNETASHVATLMYYLGKEYVVREAQDCRFIPGRQAEILCAGKRVGVFGEIHPGVLEAFGITMPGAGGEIDLDLFLV